VINRLQGETALIMQTLHCIAAGAMLFAASASAGVPTDNPRKSPMDRAVDTAATAFFSDRCHVGVSIGIVDHGRRYFYDYGTVSKEKPRLPTRGTLYEIGSITKTFTGALAAKALLEGRLNLDSDIRAYLKEPYPNLEKGGKPITLRTLASHTSGILRDIPNNDDLFQGTPDFNKLPYLLTEREKGYDRARYLRELHNIGLASEPGAKMVYSNIGIKLIGFGLENVTELSLDRLLARDIFRPLGMTGTTLVLSPSQRGRLAQPYLPGGDPAPPPRLDTDPNTGGAGGLFSSTNDMVKYARWQLDERDPVIARAHQPIWGSADSFAAGLIWDIGKTPDDERKLWYGGGTFGMSSQMILLPDSRRAYVLLANDACMNTQSQLHDMAMAIRASGRSSG
jgi:CubicO group peptidase (beta-lactamase class C family)